MTAVPPRPAAPEPLDDACGCRRGLGVRALNCHSYGLCGPDPDSPAAADSGTPASPRRTVTGGTTDSVAIHRPAQQETNPAPAATAGDGLREQVEATLAEHLRPGWVVWRTDLVADAVLALPALRDVLAAAARDAELRQAVTSLAVRFETFGEVLHDVRAAEAYADAGASLREALAPS